MTLDNYTDVLRNYIGEDEPERVLEILHVLMGPLEGEHFSHILNLQARLRGLRKQEIYFLPFDPLERGKIRYALYLLLDEIENDKRVSQYFDANRDKIVASTDFLNRGPKPRLVEPLDTIKAAPPLGLCLYLRTNDARAPDTTITLRSESYIGRLEGHAVILNDRRISRERARIFYEDGALWVEDLGSDNGTFVNDQRVLSRAALNHGCALKFYDIVFEVEIANE